MGIRAGKLTCPTCDRYMADVLRGTADALSELVGGYVGGRIGGPAGARIGADVAPVLIEHGAMAVAETVKKKRTRAQKKKSGELKKHLKTANSKARKKNGDFKKGWNQSRVMREAHRLCGHKHKRKKRSR